MVTSEETASPSVRAPLINPSSTPQLTANPSPTSGTASPVLTITNPAIATIAPRLKSNSPAIMVSASPRVTNPSNAKFCPSAYRLPCARKSPFTTLKNATRHTSTATRIKAEREKANTFMIRVSSSVQRRMRSNMAPKATDSSTASPLTISCTS
ncbi:hypothetical protein D3C84_792130 [compost metagenome]